MFQHLCVTLVTASATSSRVQGLYVQGHLHFVTPGTSMDFSARGAALMQLYDLRSAGKGRRGRGGGGGGAGESGRSARVAKDRSQVRKQPTKQCYGK